MEMCQHYLFGEKFIASLGIVKVLLLALKSIRRSDADGCTMSDVRPPPDFPVRFPVLVLESASEDLVGLEDC